MKDLAIYIKGIQTGFFDIDNMPDCCYTWGYTSFKPFFNLWHCKGVIKEKEYPLIKGYKLWLNFFCDYVGYDVSIYYPISQKKGEKIKVIFQGAKIQGYINWVHGDDGLFVYLILPLLLLEKGASKYVNCHNCGLGVYNNEDNMQLCPLCNPPF